MGSPLVGVIFQLVENTADRIRYLCTSTGNGTPTILPNFDGGVTPNLDADLNNSVSPLRGMVRTTIADQDEARRLLCGEESAGPPDIAHVRRAHLYITPRTGAAAWAVDADEGANAGDPQSAGRAVVVVTPPMARNGGGETAYLDIICRTITD